MPRIVFTIDSQGSVTIEGVGFEDSSCHAVIAPYADELGLEDVQDKPEMKKAPRSKKAQSIKQRGAQGR